MRRIASHLALLPSGILSRPLITLRDGEIVAIEQWERLDAMAGVEFYAGIVVPALVNAHCHLELSYLEGQIERRGGPYVTIRESMGATVKIKCSPKQNPHDNPKRRHLLIGPYFKQ